MSWSGLRSRWRCCVVGAACWWGVAGVAGEGAGEGAVLAELVLEVAAALAAGGLELVEGD